MSKLILVLGGARSGKSKFAADLAGRLSDRVVYIATAEGLDKEMLHRIRLHKRKRPKSWKTIEEPKDLERIRKLLAKSDRLILFECLTLWVSNLIGLREKDITNKLKKFIKFLRQAKKSAVFVSNEVGCGIVPDNPIARDFRDIQGRVNQLVAELADEVYFVVAGIGRRIK